MAELGGSGVVVFVFTDLVGSTELQDGFGRDGAAAVDAHIDLLRRQLATFGGEEVKHLGDGLMVTFVDPSAALACAVAMQRGIEALDAPQTLQIRVGLHAGTARQDNGDYFGLAVTTAKRICDLAPPGRIRCSDVVRSLAGRVDSVEYVSLGPVPLKGISEPVPLFDVVWPDRPEPLPPPTGQFVGRENELAELCGAVNAAAGGAGAFFLLTGEPGIGKTRTAEEVAAAAARAGASVHWGACSEAGGAPAYWPWTQVLRSVAARIDHETALRWAGPGRSLLGQIAAELGDPDAAPPTGAPDDRFALFDAVAGFLDRAGAERPLLIVLDDLHAADRTSLQLLDFLARRLRGLPAVLIGTSRELEVDRDPELRQAFADLGRLGHRLPLRGLPRGDIARLVAALVGAAVADDVVDTITATTGGNPFFVDEVVRLLRAEGGVDRPLTTVPTGVRDAVTQLLSLVTPATRAVLDVAAVIGREFDLAPLRRVVDADVDAAIADAVAVHLVREADRPERMRFDHALVRDTLYDALPHDRRSALHHTVGVALESCADAESTEGVTELAHHFARGGALAADRALAYSLRAGDIARARGAYDEAVDLFRASLVATDLLSDVDEQRFEVLARLSDACFNATLREDAHDATRSALALAQRLGRIDLEVTALSLPMPFDEAVVRIDERLDKGGVDDPRLRAILLTSLAHSLDETVHFARRQAVTAEAVTLARVAGDRDVLGTALNTRHGALRGSPDLAERLALAEELRQLADVSGDPQNRARAFMSLLTDLIEAGDVTRLDATLAAYFDFVKSFRRPDGAVMHLSLRGMRLMLDGRFAEAERFVIESAALAQQWWGHPVAAAETGPFHLRREQGRLAEIEARVRSYADTFPQFPWRMRLAVLLADLGRLDESRAEFERVAAKGFADLRLDNLTFSLPLLAELAHVHNDAERAELLYARCLAYDGQCFAASGMMVFCTGAVARYLGLLAMTRGDDDAAQRHLQAALAQHTRMGSRPWLAHTQYDLGRLQLARGDASAAAELFAAAAAAAESMGMGGLTAKLAAAAPIGDSPSPTLPEPAREVFRAEGDAWVVSFSGTTVRVRASKGMQLIARLLAEPGRELHAMDLDQAQGGVRRTTSREASDAGLEVDTGSTAPLLDERAKREYKRRLDDLEQEIDEASLHNDPARSARAEEEKAFLIAELSRAVGLGGRDRPTGSASERARVSVTRAIRSAIARIAQHHPTLGEHLAATVRTGTFCSYIPDPRVPLRWDL